MIRQYSTALGSSQRNFQRKGIFNGFIEIDTKLYIDPHLLKNSSAPEIATGGKVFRKYFIDTIKIFKQTKNQKGPLWKEAVKRLTFREMPELSLGYSSSTTRGSAIGSTLALSISKTAYEIIKAGIEDPEIFELVGLLEEGIGADRISDMAASILQESLYKYSQRMVKELKLSSTKYVYSGKTYTLPYDEKTSKIVILVPNDILRDLPVAYDWDSIDIVCAHNSTLRESINKIIGKSWRDATKNMSKRQLKGILLDKPAVIKDLINQYKNKPIESYDFSIDPLGETNWYSKTQEYAKNFPLDLSKFRNIDADKIFPLVLKICLQFKQLIENNGLYELLYNDSRRIKNERASQLLFYGLADAYCQANNVDLNRETNAGKGPVDFKISSGYNARVNIEMKYSSNSNLVNGYLEQIKAYNKAEKTKHSIFLVIQTKSHKKKLQDLKDIHRSESKKGSRVPELIIVDGRRQVSASKLRRGVMFSLDL